MFEKRTKRADSDARCGQQEKKSPSTPPPPFHHASYNPAMAPTSTNGTSSIARALAGMTESVVIPKPRDADFWAGKDSFAAVAARSAPTTKRSTAGLPTPPNSISPSLPPQAYKTRAETSNGPPTPPGPVHVDSDIDLEDEVEHAKEQDSPQRGLTSHRLGDLANLDAVGAITPSLLAKHHLPGILLDHGPLAIRHVMGYLTTSVPGFSGIPPAKARRLVVGALEGRGSDGSQGGPEGDVVFEKVGWGRWDARKRGQPGRDGGERRSSQPTGGLRIPIHSTHRSRSKNDGIYGSHQDSDHAYDTPGEDISVLEHEADRMSLDDDDDDDDDGGNHALNRSFGQQPRRRHIPDLESGEITDEEDWASIGAAALRQGSFPLTGGIMPTHSRNHTHVEPKSRGRGAAAGLGVSGRRAISKNTRLYSPSRVSKSMPSTNNHHVHYNHDKHHHETTARGAAPLPQPLQQLQQQPSHQSMVPENAFPEGGDAQDREAVEALLKLSSF